jgi:hypothetical protein
MFHPTQIVSNDTPQIATSPTTDKPSDAVALVGHLGEGLSDEYRRLYMNQASELFLEIPVEAIVGGSSAAGDGAQSLIWVRRDATLAWYESVLASSFETPVGPGPARYEWPRP